LVLAEVRRHLPKTFHSQRNPTSSRSPAIATPLTHVGGAVAAPKTETTERGAIRAIQASLTTHQSTSRFRPP
jgi:hypothetical protein